MMNRRDLLVRFAGFGIATPPTLTGVDHTKPFSWLGWRVQWLPWQRPVAQDVYVGFYVASKGDQHRHWCTSGYGGTHVPGAVFSTSIREGWAVVTAATTPLQLDRIQLKTLRYMLAYLERPEQDPDLLILPDA